MIKRIFSFLTIVLISTSCANNLSEVDALTKPMALQQEEATGVKILYSDSATVKVRITADRMIRHTDKSNPRDVFPDGIFVEFLSENGQPYCWLESDWAERDERDHIITARGNVNFYNRKKETLTSTELIWDEESSILSTEKFVRIIQPERGDTSYGYGFVTNEEFNQFEIKRKTSSRISVEKFKQALKTKKAPSN